MLIKKTRLKKKKFDYLYKNGLNLINHNFIFKFKPVYVKPVPNGDNYFVETFESNVIGSKWIKSKAKKEDVEETIAKYDGEWSIESSLDSLLEGDKGLVLKTKAKHHAISAKLSKKFDFTKNKPLVVQYVLE